METIERKIARAVLEFLSTMDDSWIEELSEEEKTDLTTRLAAEVKLTMELGN